MTHEDDMRMFNAREILRHIIETGQMTPFEIINETFPYLRNPWNLSKDDKMRIIGMVIDA
jgi:hypothetical protein